MSSGTDARVLVAGEATGVVCVLDEPLSFWGGFDPLTGTIIDVHHPQHGRTIAGTMLVMPGGRGSSSASSVLAEAVRLGNAPRALLLDQPDEILVLGALVAEELYNQTIPVVVLAPNTYSRLIDGSTITISAHGTLT